MKTKNIAMICTAIVGIIAILAIASNRNREIELEATKIREAADVEQTEERSQFWQKAIPWGSDEDEVSE